MAGYMGNPRTIVLAQESIPVANYEYSSNPTTFSNPKYVPCSWLNTISGELFICIDNTDSLNVWKGQLGTTIG